jgi:diacylglycerol kinase
LLLGKLLLLLFFDLIIVEIINIAIEEMADELMHELFSGNLIDNGK